MQLPGSRRYDRIGEGYAMQRLPDPRIGAQVDAALVGARSVLNIGAGAGSYEPAFADVVALDPSPTMLRQRPPGSAPTVRGIAEQLPFADQSFDAAMGVLTLHHWHDWPGGLREAMRVARRRVFLVYEPAMSVAFWLVDRYFPVLADLEEGRPSVTEVARALDAHTVIPVLVPHDCTDGFLGANWRRPEAYLDPVTRGAISSFRMVPETELAEGLTRLADDLDSGEWARQHAALLECESLDLGYRLVVSG